MSENNRLNQFRKERSLMNEKILELNHLGIKRFFNLDSNIYRDGALNSKTKDLLGLVASTVLRSNDCIDYHLEQYGFTKHEIIDALNMALVAGGSIIIPHLRYATGTMELLESEGTL